MYGRHHVWAPRGAARIRMPGRGAVKSDCDTGMAGSMLPS
eukprot:SAG31_NODE_33548_length_342_cov_1.213992_1_plen_39_part_01